MDPHAMSNRELDREVWIRVLGKAPPSGIFYPSTDMNDALSVARALHQRTREASTGRLRGGFALRVLDEKYGTGWLATFESHLDADGERYTQADTPARAVCIAALRAVEHCPRLRPEGG